MMPTRLSRPLVVRLAILTGLTVVVVSGAAMAADATLMQVQMTRDEPGEPSGLFVRANYEFDLPQPLIDALHRGIALYFTHEFVLTKDRWYWTDKTVADSTFVIRLSFNPLTRRYRVSYNGLSLNFDTLDQALPLIKNVRRWRVARHGIVGDPTNFSAEVRLRLDVGKLPKPMQVTSGNNEDWTLSSGWHPVEIPPEATDFDSEPQGAR